MQELFPANKQNVEHFSMYFNEAGLKELSDYLRVQQSLGTRKELQKELQERLSQECPIKEVKVPLLLDAYFQSHDLIGCVLTSHFLGGQNRFCIEVKDKFFLLFIFFIIYFLLNIIIAIM